MRTSLKKKKATNNYFGKTSGWGGERVRRWKKWKKNPIRKKKSRKKGVRRQHGWRWKGKGGEGKNGGGDTKAPSGAKSESWDLLPALPLEE